MRAILDTNILISYLLHDAPESPITQIVQAGVRGEYTLLTMQSLWQELQTSVQSKNYLRDRISCNDLRQLVESLRQVSEIVPPPAWIPRVTRDPKDDYLLACAAVAGADYLVTGDEDLLALGKVGDLQIVAARRFWDVITHDSSSKSARQL